jgi:YidC/Oxa1 family membrane protein insertase
VIVDIVILDQIEAALQWLLETYHGWVGNWGLAIILMTATVRLMMVPVFVRQMRSMAAMQAIQPKVKALQNKYKNKSREDKQEMQKELMELYKEHGVNPFASCLPMVFQIPVFIGLYRVLTNFSHSNPPPPDPGFLGIDNIFVKLNTVGGPTEVIIVVLYLASMLGSTLLFSFITDKQQKYLFAGMSIFFVFFIVNVPIGVGIYWITTNIWTICQNGIIRQTMGHQFPHLQKPAAGGSGGRGSTGTRPPKPAAAKPTGKGGGGRGSGRKARGGRRR